MEHTINDHSAQLAALAAKQDEQAKRLDKLEAAYQLHERDISALNTGQAENKLLYEHILARIDKFEAQMISQIAAICKVPEDDTELKRDELAAKERQATQDNYMKLIMDILKISFGALIYWIFKKGV